MDSLFSNNLNREYVSTWVISVNCAILVCMTGRWHWTANFVRMSSCILQSNKQMPNKWVSPWTFSQIFAFFVFEGLKENAPFTVSLWWGLKKTASSSTLLIQLLAAYRILTLFHYKILLSYSALLPDALYWIIYFIVNSHLSSNLISFVTNSYAQYRNTA